MTQCLKPICLIMDKMTLVSTKSRNYQMKKRPNRWGSSSLQRTWIRVKRANDDVAFDQHIKIMDVLNRDLESARHKINQWFSEYNNVTAQTHKLQQASQIQQILSAIVTLDQDTIQHQAEAAQDATVKEQLTMIVEEFKIRKSAPQAPTSLSQPEHESEPPIQKKKQAPKREARIKEGGQSKPGFFGSMMNHFTSKDKKPKQIILPDKEPDCYYDPVSRTYVFEGEQPPKPKTTPKPPSAGQKKKTTKEPESQKGAVNDLTAPPSFKRRGGAKPKPKARGQVAVIAQIEEPMTFENTLAKINAEFERVIAEVMNGAYQQNVEGKEDVRIAHETVQVGEKVLQAIEEVRVEQNRLINQLGNLTNSQQPLKIMESVLRQVESSAFINAELVSFVSFNSDNYVAHDQNQLAPKPVFEYGGDESLRSQMENLRASKKRIEDESTNLRHKLSISRRELQSHTEKIHNNETELNTLRQQHQQAQIQLLELQRAHQSLKVDNQTLQRNNELLVQQLEHDTAQERKQTGKKFDDLSRKAEQYLGESRRLGQQSQQLREELQRVQEEKERLKGELRVAQASLSRNTDKVGAELERQRVKIESQLKGYEEREKGYLKSIKQIHEQESTIHDLDSALLQQQQLLNEILQTRLSLVKNQQPVSLIPVHQVSTRESSVIHDLSDVVSSITETHLDRLEALSQQHARLHRKYTQAKGTIQAMRKTHSEEQMSLNRSVTRLKSLIETHRSEKEEVEERCTGLEIECDKLKRRLLHYKQEEDFNRSYLSRLKQAGAASLNESVASLQEDNEQLAERVEGLEKQVEEKGQSLGRLQIDLEELLGNYQSTQQRLHDAQRISKQAQRQARNAVEQKEELANKVKLIELKLQHQRQKNDQLVSKQQAKIATLEQNHSAKLQVLRTDLETARGKEEEALAQVKIWIEQAQKKGDWARQLRQKAALSQEKQERMLSKKERENEELEQLLQGMNQQVQQLSQTVTQLSQEKERLDQLNEQLSADKLALVERENSLSVQLERIVDEHLKEMGILRHSQGQMTRMVQTMGQQCQLYEQQLKDTQSETRAQLQALQKQHAHSQELTEQLLIELDQSKQDIARLQQLIQKENAKSSSHHDKVSQLEVQIEQLTQQLSTSQQQTQQSLELVQGMEEETSTLQAQLTHTRTEAMNLEQKVLTQQKQIVELESELNNQSQATVVKAEQLEEKSNLLTEKEESIVMQQEEIDELRNQLRTKDSQLAQLKAETVKSTELALLQEQVQSLKGQLRSKQEQLGGMTSDLEFLTQEVTRLTEIQQSVAALNEEKESLKSEVENLTLANSKAAEQYSRLSQQKLRAQLLAQQHIPDTQRVKELQEALSKLQSQLQKERQDQVTAKALKDEDIENQMQFLLTEIQSKDSQLSQLSKTLREKDVEITQLIQETQSMKNKVKELELNQAGHKQPSSSSEQTGHLELITLLQNSVKESQEKLTQKEALIARQQSAFNQMDRELKTATRGIEEVSQMLNNKNTLLEQTEAELEEKERLVMRLQKGSKRDSDKDKKIQELEKTVSQLTELFELQENELNTLKNQKASRQQSQAFETDDKELARAKQQASEFKTQVATLMSQFDEKEAAYQRKIEELQQDKANLLSLKTINTKLEESIKTLEQQNSTLLDEKVELMKSNDFLVGVNQKLVANQSPHSASKPTQVKAPMKTLPSPGLQAKEQKSKDAQPEQQQQGGFFSSISSLFLTPTETQRMQRK